MSFIYIYYIVYSVISFETSRTRWSCAENSFFVASDKVYIPT